MFEAHRRRLFGLAYRMLGSVAEAEDVVQDAFLRWLAADRAGVARPGAWLATAATRLCLDRLRAARRARALYVGSWLPDPLPDAAPDLPSHMPPHMPRDAVGEAPPDPAPGPDAALERAEAVSLALMLALDRLGPAERAAFLLHDVFGARFADIAATLGRTEAGCRQLAARARARLADAAPSVPRAAAPSDPEAARIADAFFAAARSGDAGALAALLAEGAALVSDGGGRARAALNPILGRDRVARFFAGIAAKRSRLYTDAAPVLARRLTLNGLPGLLSLGADGALQTLSVEIAAGRVVAVYMTRNPHKLAHLRAYLPENAPAPPS
ncbi:MAG: RNA polymerase sigma factor SigJ [Rhodobacteraceae bacterium]|nr:RNA polymerase sigma factor SigJ [Paracoccaceae bacterium]